MVRGLFTRDTELDLVEEEALVIGEASLLLIFTASLVLRIVEDVPFSRLS